MKTKILIGLMVAAALAGCSTPPQQEVYTYRDDMGSGIDLIMDNELDSGKNPTELIWFNASRVREGAWGGKYYLEVRYEGAEVAGFLDIGPGETLELVVDGTKRTYKGMGSVNTRRRTTSGTFVENAIYPADTGDIKEIANAKTVEVRVQGAGRTVYREMKPENIGKFRNFVLTYGGF